MSKLKISQKQYNAILLREQKSRLEASGEILSEKVGKPTQDSNENWREVVLGVAQMLGVPLTGHNKILAQDALKKDSVMAQIKATLEDENKLKGLVDAFEAKGMKNPSDRLSSKAEKLMNVFNQISANNHLKYKLDTKVVNTLQELGGKAKGKDYEFNEADVTVDSFKEEPEKPVKIQDTLTMKFIDGLFVNREWTLTPDGNDIITLAIKEVEKQGGKTLGVEIEISTDSQPSPDLKKPHDESGNVLLALLRSRSVSNLINGLDGSISLTHREIPNNGSNVVKPRDFFKAITDSKKNSVKEKAKEFRYVKLILTAVFESQEKGSKVIDLIKKYRGEITKVVKTASKNRNIDAEIEFKNKKWRCSSDGESACSTF